MSPQEPTESNEDTLPLESLDRIERTCREFEGAWKRGDPPRIEDYLGRSTEGERSKLFGELLALEFEYRRRRDETPVQHEYELRFPEFASQIHRLFHESAPAEPERHGAPGISEPQAPPEIAHFLSARYELVGLCGAGGMGWVYRGRHKSLDREVAIKLIRPECSTERFQQEAKLLAKVRSPHVITVHDFDVLPNGMPIFVMEWVDGADLSEVLAKRGGRLDEDGALQWMRQTCEGMRAVAERGIVHRDLKPSNIIIDSSGKARVGDFGLAREPSALHVLSRTGDVLGTPYYMAPEQATNPRAVDTRADVYSFGATFYHALTGTPPFLGETPFEVLFKHKTEPLVSPRSRNPAITEHTSELLERCLAKSAGDRFLSFSELGRHLGETPSGGSPWDEVDDDELEQYLLKYQSRREDYLRRRRSDLYTFPDARELRILVGDIVEQEVDAIVSSDAGDLPMDGGVSLSIREAAGPELERQARDYPHVRAGRAVVTSAGNLKARFIFHGITLGFQESKLLLPSRDLISEVMASCFYHAETLDVESIAFPLLGTGAGGLPKDVCLDTMFRFLARTLLRGVTCVRQATIVLFPNGELPPGDPHRRVPTSPGPSPDRREG